MEWALVERIRETERLHGLLSGAADGAGRLVLIEGTAGVGKTRLLAEARARAAHEGMLVLGARGSELEQVFAFGVVRQLFEAHLSDPGVREWALAGVAAPAEAAFGVPVEGRDGEPAADASFSTLHSLYWLVLNLAERRPVVLAIDDLHWCDRASLQFIAYLAARLDGQPVLLASTLRTGEPGTDPALLAEIVGTPAAAAIWPGPLSADAVAELIRERLGPSAEPEFCAACHVATGGNPLLLGQLLSALRADDVRPVAGNAGLVRDVGPTAISRTVSLHLARLPASATTVARAVAVLGDGADLPAIAAYAELDQSVVVSAAGQLTRAEILTSRVPLGFVHPLVRDAVYHGLSQAERELEHARAADVAIASGAPAEQVAAQLLKTARRGESWVVDRLVAAARAAVAQGSPDGAVSYLARALEEPPPVEQRPQILLELGLAEGLTSGPDAVEHLRAACAAMDSAADRAAAAPVLAQSLIFTGAPEQAAAFASETAAQLPPELADLAEVLEAIELGTTMFGMSEPDQIRRLGEYRTRPVGPGPGAKMLAALAAWEWAMTGGQAGACAELARAALADDTMVAADNGFLTVPAIGVLFLADLDEAPTRWDRLLADSHADGSLFAISCVHLWNGITMARRGELAEAEDLIRTGRSELSLWGELPVDGAYFTSMIALLRLERGHVEDARRELGPRPDRKFDAYDAAHLWLRTEVEVLLAEGRNVEALARAEEYGAVVGRLSNPAWVPWRSLRAIALHRLGRVDEAIGEAEREVEHAQAWGAPGTVGRSLRILGTLQGDDGFASLEAAIAVLDGSAAKLELAKALAAYGALLRRVGRPQDARAPLRRALELAEMCGAEVLEADARTELYAAGSRPRSTALSGPDALTASERRVASLAADGLTNRDIAQRLFVTPKTVEVHLSASYRKLGIASRRELAGTLATA
jgi:DNA-binding NarL/FixJ family response regulator